MGKKKIPLQNCTQKTKLSMKNVQKWWIEWRITSREKNYKYKKYRELSLHRWNRDNEFQLFRLYIVLNNKIPTMLMMMMMTFNRKRNDLLSVDWFSKSNYARCSRICFILDCIIETTWFKRILKKNIKINTWIFLEIPQINGSFSVRSVIISNLDRIR